MQKPTPLDCWIVAAYFSYENEDLESAAAFSTRREALQYGLWLIEHDFRRAVSIKPPGPDGDYQRRIELRELRALLAQEQGQK